jgi:Sec7-like guanine-nucleotide exchange factor
MLTQYKCVVLPEVANFNDLRKSVKKLAVVSCRWHNLVQTSSRSHNPVLMSKASTQASHPYCLKTHRITSLNPP